jgi:hypothetical protein
LKCWEPPTLSASLRLKRLDILEERKISFSSWESGQFCVHIWPVAWSMYRLCGHGSITIYGYFEITFLQNIHVVDLKGSGKTQCGATK